MTDWNRRPFQRVLCSMRLHAWRVVACNVERRCAKAHEDVFAGTRRECECGAVDDRT